MITNNKTAIDNSYGTKMSHSNHAKLLTKQLKHNHNFKVEIAIVSSDFCFQLAGHSLAKFTNKNTKDVYYIHISDNIISNPRIIYGEDKFNKYLADFSKKSLGSILISENTNNTKKIATCIEQFTNNKMRLWLGPYHNCHSFARHLVKKSGAKTEYILPLIPKIPTIALNRFNAKNLSST